jgi:hypothetical protein
MAFLSAEEKSTAIFQEKPSTVFQEDEEMQKPAVKTDYSGATEKTDPKEIALVKKLDRWIMPMLWSMYWLNYLDRNAIALARLNDLEEDLNLDSTRMLTQLLRLLQKIPKMCIRISDLRQHPLCRLPPWSNSQQYVFNTNSPKPVHGHCYDAMGCCLGAYCCLQQLHWTPPHTLLSWSL